MRAGARPFWWMAAAALAVVGFQAAAAFQYADLAPRDVKVYLVADSAAYVALSANGGSKHTCFVSEDGGTGKLSVSMGAISGCPGGGAGTGINPGVAADGRSTRYAFHSLLNVTNKGTKTVNVWVNATTTSGSSSLLETAIKADGQTMSDSDYAASTATPLSLAPGQLLQVGLRATTGSLTAGNPVTGTIQVVARR